ncbi:hypothetical protein BC834DRAFT_845969 [Gloeopeniophorella convolvens]|nr:hypothetical protein BC834DRAFT_845969 [Gloeopeniophorella convolvens]
MTKYHPQIFYDAQSLLHAIAPTPETLQARGALRDRLREVVASCAGPTRVDLEDVSMASYAEDLDIAPLELMIVDKDHPDGLPPSTDRSRLSDVYDPRLTPVSRLAAHLQDHGFDGTIQSTDAQRRDGVSTSRPGSSDPPPRAADDGGAFRWPRYKRSPKREIVYPAVLDAATPERFALSLPNPATRHTQNLLYLYSRRNPHLRQLTSLIYVWMRSWGVVEISPRTLCLMLIRFFQEEHVATLTETDRTAVLSSEHAKASTHYTTTVWMPYDVDGQTQPLLLDVSYALYPVSYPESDFSPVLLRFFKWITSKKLHAASPNGSEGWPILRISHPNVIDGRFATELRAFSEHSAPWSRHQLIVPDPSAITHNHAFTVHRSTLRYLHVLADSCASLLANTHPLYAIFGPHYKPDVFAEQRRRSRSPSPSLAHLSIRSPLGGLRLERRAYAPDPRMRDDLRRMYHTGVPGQMVHELRRKTIAKVANAIQVTFGPKYRVEAFGSTQYGVDAQTSDLDLVVIDPDRMEGFAPDVNLKSLPRVYKIHEVSAALQHAGFKILQKIPKATVPIVKFKDPASGIQCDLNINDQLGTINTGLIRHYCDLQPVLRPLLLAIKRWARPLGYNSPSVSGGMPVTFSSYALAMMTIGLFQARGLLPNLQDGPDLDQGGIFWVRTRTEERVRCDARWRAMPGWTPPRTVELDEALQDWFQYWGLEHDYTQHVLSVRLGGVVLRAAPCTRREAYSLRPGLFTALRAGNAPDALRETGAAGRNPLASKRGRARVAALPEAERGVLAWSSAQVEEAARAGGARAAVRNAGGGAARALEAEAEAEAFAEEEEDAAPLAEESDDEEAEDDALGAGESDSAQPERWASDVLCIADPFIRAKNLAGSLKPPTVARFRADCQRVVMRLRLGCTLDALLRLDPRTRPPSPPPEPRQRRPGQGRGRTNANAARQRRETAQRRDERGGAAARGGNSGGGGGDRGRARAGAAA